LKPKIVIGTDKCMGTIWGIKYAITGDTYIAKKRPDCTKSREFMENRTGNVPMESEMAEKLQVNPCTKPFEFKIEADTLRCPARRQRGENKPRAGKFVPTNEITKT
jgi:hypothetical protein